MLIAFAILLILGVPMGFSIGISTLIYLFLDPSVPEVLVAQRAYSATNSFILVAIPFFVLAGELMNESGVTRRLMAFANAIVGHLRGGLGHVTVVSEMILSGISGSAAADASMLGTVLIPAMRESGYDDDFSSALVASASVEGPIIPPSIPMVVYGATANISVGALFVAGIIPGILLGIGLMSWVAIASVRHGYPKGKRKRFREFLGITKGAIPALLMPIIIIGGIIRGIFTPTEAAAVAVIYAFVLGLLQKQLSLRRIPGMLFRTAKITGVVMLIVAMASTFAWVLAANMVPQQLAKSASALTTNKTMVLVLINILFLIVGCLMETMAAIIIIIPSLLPLVNQLGIDPIQFGMIVILNLGLGLITPPFGMSLFIISSISRSGNHANRFSLPPVFVHRNPDTYFGYLYS